MISPLCIIDNISQNKPIHLCAQGLRNRSGLPIFLGSEGYDSERPVAGDRGRVHPDPDPPGDDVEPAASAEGRRGPGEGSSGPWRRIHGAGRGGAGPGAVRGANGRERPRGPGSGGVATRSEWAWQQPQQPQQ